MGRDGTAGSVSVMVVVLELDDAEEELVVSDSTGAMTGSITGSSSGITIGVTTPAEPDDDDDDDDDEDDDDDDDDDDALLLTAVFCPIVEKPLDKGKREKNLGKEKPLTPDPIS